MLYFFQVTVLCENVIHILLECKTKVTLFPGQNNRKVMADTFLLFVFFFNKITLLNSTSEFGLMIFLLFLFEIYDVKGKKLTVLMIILKWDKNA